jgi:hypothetical protein
MRAVQVDLLDPGFDIGGVPLDGQVGVVDEFLRPRGAR